MLIGVPVAFTPGFEPHADAETVPAAAELDAPDDEAGAAADEDVPPAGAALLVVELELHAARAPRDSAANAAAAVRVRQWTDIFMCSAFSWLTASYSSSERVHAPLCSDALTQGLARKKTPFPDPQVNGASLHCLSNVV
jgi:hypothetical protein